jgi:hypothetical protein
MPGTVVMAKKEQRESAGSGSRRPFHFNADAPVAPCTETMNGAYLQMPGAHRAQPFFNQYAQRLLRRNHKILRDFLFHSPHETMVEAP